MLKIIIIIIVIFYNIVLVAFDPSAVQVINYYLNDLTTLETKHH